MFERPKQLWRLCLAFGIIVIAISILIFPAFPEKMADSEVSKTPVYAFEFARTESDLIAIFGEPGDPMRADRIARMDRGNRLDFAYMFVYALFIASFFFARYTENNRKFWLCMALTGLVAGASDFAENLILLEVTSDLESANGLGCLWLPVHLKFACLYICAGGAGWCLCDQSKRWLKGLGAIQILISVSALVHLFVSGGEEGTIAIVLAWLIQLGVAAARVIKP